jgi:hypothetical protein
MQWRLCALAMAVGLAGCAETTTFLSPGEKTVNMVDCEKTMALESCQAAKERVCPEGYAERRLKEAQNSEIPKDLWEFSCTAARR